MPSHRRPRIPLYSRIRPFRATRLGSIGGSDVVDPVVRPAGVHLGAFGFRRACLRSVLTGQGDRPWTDAADRRDAAALASSSGGSPIAP